MKSVMKIFVLLFFAVVSATAFSQSLAKYSGSYNTVAFDKPKNIPPPASNVMLVQDKKQNNVVWVQNLLPGGAIRCINEGSTLAVQPQTVGGYKISFGCILLQGSQLMISLNNKVDCPDLRDAQVTVGNGTVTAPGVKVGPGGVSAPGAKVSSKGTVDVNTKGLFPGIQYIGKKVGAADDEEDDD